MGIRPKYSIADVITGKIELKDVITRGPGGVDILPAGSAVIELLDFKGRVLQKLNDAYSQFETTITKYIVIQTDRFYYQLVFGDTSSDFALYSVLYDHIENTFVTSHQSFWQGIWGLIAIINAIGLIIAFVAWRITSSKKSKKKTKKN